MEGGSFLGLACLELGSRAMDSPGSACDGKSPALQQSVQPMAWGRSPQMEPWSVPSSQPSGPAWRPASPSPLPAVRMGAQVRLQPSPYLPNLAQAVVFPGSALPPPFMPTLILGKGGQFIHPPSITCCSRDCTISFWRRHCALPFSSRRWSTWQCLDRGRFHVGDHTGLAS